MREPEGIETPLPGRSSERTWSKRREPDIRNVEAVGSNPITSTKSPVQRAKVGSPQRSVFRRVFTCLYRQSLVLQESMKSGGVEVASAMT